MLIGAENSNLRKSGSRVRVSSAELAIFVVAPPIKISILIHRVSEILTNRDIAELCLTLDIRFLFKLLEGLTFVNLPSADSIVLVETGKVVLVSANFLDVAQGLKVVEHLILITQIHLPS